MSISFISLDWRPIIENNVAVMFVATGFACEYCARQVRARSDTLTFDGDVDGGQHGNVYCRSKGIDIADMCEFCGTDLVDLSNGVAEELRFWVEVNS